MSALAIAAAVLLGAGLVGLLASLAWARRRAVEDPEPLWDWGALEPELDAVTFPEPGFLWGTASAAHQVEGGHTANNWARWERDPGPKGKGRIQNGDVAGAACEHWDRYPEDLDRMVEELGVDSYRFSLSWSKIEPEPGVFDEDAIQHYHDVIDACRARGLVPMVTLHHFTHPLWFEDLGSFEDAGNIAHIARFTARVFREYGAKVPYWCTFNEPGPFSVMGWGLGVFPPGKQSPALLGRVIRNLCAAHVEMVRTIRGLPHGADVHVGLVKNIFQMDPWRPGNPVHRLLCDVADHVYNESILGFLRTGRVRIQLPGLVSIDEQLDGPRGDFVGLNYYANLLLDPLMNREPPFEAHSRPGQIMTDMPYTIYAEGFHKALHRERDPRRPRRPPGDLDPPLPVRDAQGHGRGRRRARLLLLVDARQFRVGGGIPDALRAVRGRLHHAGAAAPGRRAAVHRDHPPQPGGGRCRGLRRPRPSCSRPGRGRACGRRSRSRSCRWPGAG
jgi:beta-glucosidase